MLGSCACYARCLATPSPAHSPPGPPPRGLCFPPPRLGAGPFPGACPVSQASQSGHHEPGVSLALATQSSNWPSGGPPDQYWYFGLVGGFTTPAIWPEPAIT